MVHRRIEPICQARLTRYHSLKVQNPHHKTALKAGSKVPNIETSIGTLPTLISYLHRQQNCGPGHDSRLMLFMPAISGLEATQQH